MGCIKDLEAREQEKGKFWLGAAAENSSLLQETNSANRSIRIRLDTRR